MPNPLERRHYEGNDVTVTAWHFQAQGWMFQVTAKDDTMKWSGNGYVLLSLTGAAELYRELQKALVDRGVVAPQTGP